MTTGQSASLVHSGGVERESSCNGVAGARRAAFRQSGGEPTASGSAVFGMGRRAYPVAVDGARDLTSRGKPHWSHLLLGAALAGAAVLAQAQSGSRPVVANVIGGPAGAAQSIPMPPSTLQESAPANSSLILELRRLVEKKSLSELRTTYNGQYGASLLFKPDDLTYYVALFQQRQFWRVLKSSDAAKAEELYRAFARQTEELSKVDIDRIRLDAERAHAEARIQAESAELETLRGNLAYQRQREREVIVAQEQARQQARELAAQEQAARERLKSLQQSIQELEAQQTNLLQADLLPGSRRK